jgi:hypothetical protein
MDSFIPSENLNGVEQLKRSPLPPRKTWHVSATN